MFKNLSRIDICHRMSAICQMSADESLPGDEQARHQMASDKFRNEADALTLDHLQKSPYWHLGSQTSSSGNIV